MSILYAKHVIKRYPGTVALDDVSVEFESGKIHAFIGKNGSGKSTLLKIFSGAVIRDSGEVAIDDRRLEIRNPQDAFREGISTVYQELSIISGLTVAENIFLGRMPMSHGLIDWKEANRQAGEILDDLNIDIPVEETAEHLSVGQCQMVEIAKAMSFGPKVLQLDEPTSALAKGEIDSLFRILKRLKKKDIIIIYVSHRLHELWEIADTCTVLRDGRFVGKVDMEAITRKEMVHMMFGDVDIKIRPDDLKVVDEVVLEARNLTRPGKFENISFQLRKGEVLGIAGMLGAGRTELLRSIFGAEPFLGGELYCNGKRIKHPTPEVMKQCGMAMTQENRQKDGLIKVHSIMQNMNYAVLDVVFRHLFVDAGKEMKLAMKQVEDLEIKAGSVENPVTSLSGGNQQKVVVGNWLNINPSIILLDEPSRGIDVNAKQQIFQIIWQQSRKGISSIMVSSELEELLEVCHRILIMKDGKFIGEVYPENVKIDELYSLCMGGQEE